MTYPYHIKAPVVTIVTMAIENPTTRRSAPGVFEGAQRRYVDLSAVQ